MTEFKVIENRGGDALKLTFSNDTLPPAEVPTAFAPSWPLAIGLVIIKNPELAVECGMSRHIIDACRDLGIPGAQVLGTVLMKFAEMKDDWPGPAAGQKFELPLDQPLSADMRFPGPDGNLLSRTSLTDLL